jgi:hypothetical protein
MRALLGDRAGAEADFEATGGGALGIIVRTVLWWDDRALMARLADDFENRPTGAIWEVSAPFLRALSRRESFPEADALFERLVAGTPPSRNRCRHIEAIADWFGASGDHERALAWLERLDTPSFVNLLWLDRSPPLAPLRDDSRFVHLRGVTAARAADLWR